MTMKKYSLTVFIALLMKMPALRQENRPTKEFSQKEREFRRIA